MTVSDDFAGRLFLIGMRRSDIRHVQPRPLRGYGSLLLRRLAVLTVTALAPGMPLDPARAQIVSRQALVPVSNWEASYVGGLCRLERVFTANGQSHLLVLEQVAPGAFFDLALLGPSLTEITNSKPLLLRFSEADPGTAAAPVTGRHDTLGRLVILNGVGPAGAIAAQSPAPGNGELKIDLETAKVADRVSLEQSNRIVTFETGALAGAFLVLNECTAQIMRSWGFDPRVQYALQRNASPMEPRRLSERTLGEYPPEALRQKRGGTSVAVVMIDPLGTPTDCRIIVTSGFADLDKAVCKGLSKGRYVAALDTGGQATPSFWVTRVTLAPN